MTPRTVFLGAAFALALPLGAQQTRAITFEDFVAVRAVSDPQLSPDGRTILYAVRTADVAANRRTTRTYAIASGGGASRIFPATDVVASEARWSPDGTRVAYVAADQLWIANADGGHRVRVTTLHGGATGPVWSPTGDRVAFTSRVFPACTSDDCNVARAKAMEANKVKAHVADQLMYRHWNAWDDGTRAHLFVVAPDGSGLRDLVPAAGYDVPPGPFGGSEGYAFSPDGAEIAYTAKDQGRAEAWTTDVNLYTVSVSGGAPMVVTAANKGADQNPVYSSDGRYIAFASQARAGFESDRWRLMLYDRRTRASRELLPRWDRNADAYLFAPGMTSLLVQTGDAGRDKLYRFALSASADGTLRAGDAELLVGDHNNTGFALARDGRTIAWLRDAVERPAEVWLAELAPTALRAARAVTHENDALVAQLEMNPVEDFWFTGANGARVQGFVMKPPHWVPGKKYPGILLIHGGPQGAWIDNWGARWNFQLFAATGAAIIVVNPRGSTGYGQKFVDEVSSSWGDKPYTDLMRGLDTALARHPWIDPDALGAAGGSYGGYMVNWIAGHTRRFKALVSHAGVFNLENMATATEELWFTEWEFGGPFWNPKAMTTQYRVYSPHLHVKNFATPTLVTGGELDYRVPYTENVSLFTALQRRNVPSRLVLFPDEGHWILKPQNQRLWWSEVQGWMKRYLSTATKA